MVVGRPAGSPDEVEEERRVVQRMGLAMLVAAVVSSGIWLQGAHLALWTTNPPVAG